MKISADRLQLDSKRSSAARFFCENYSREKRYLIIFERDFSSFLSSKDYLMQKDLEHQYYFDFLVSFDSLNEKIKEFGWTVEFLGANGIDYLAICKLYNAVA